MGKRKLDRDRKRWQGGICVRMTGGGDDKLGGGSWGEKYE